MATNWRAGSFSEARRTFRPIRPNPLMPIRIAMVELLRSEKKDAGWRTTGIERAILLRQQKVVKQSESSRATQIRLGMKVSGCSLLAACLGIPSAVESTICPLRALGSLGHIVSAL